MLQRKKEKSQVSHPDTRILFVFEQITCLSRAVAEDLLPCLAQRPLAAFRWFCPCFILGWSLWLSIHYRHRPFHLLGILLYTETNICIFICFFAKVLTIQAGDHCALGSFKMHKASKGAGSFTHWVMQTTAMQQATLVRKLHCWRNFPAMHTGCRFFLKSDWHIVIHCCLSHFLYAAVSVS